MLHRKNINIILAAFLSLFLNFATSAQSSEFNFQVAPNRATSALNRGRNSFRGIKNMKRNLYRSLFFVLLFMSMAASVSAQFLNARGGGGGSGNSRITYHGGQVMQGTTNVYFIWYGDWSNNSAQQIIPELIAFIGNSAYFRINTTYPDANGQTPSGGLVYSGDRTDLYSHGQALDEDAIEGIISDQIVSGGLPLDLNGIYLVLSAIDTDISGFLDGRCQFHGDFWLVGADVRYVFVPNSAHYPYACATQFVGTSNQFLPTPNDNLGADAMASWVIHGISGAITNPNGFGWFDGSGKENTDKCQGTFGQTFLTANGAKANLRFGDRYYLLQQNWLNDRKGRCALSYP